MGKVMIFKRKNWDSRVSLW